MKKEPFTEKFIPLSDYEKLKKQIHNLANKLNQIRVPNLFNISDPILDDIRKEKTDIAKELFQLARSGR